MLLVGIVRKKIEATEKVPEMSYAFAFPSCLTRGSEKGRGKTWRSRSTFGTQSTSLETRCGMLSERLNQGEAERRQRGESPGKVRRMVRPAPSCDHTCDRTGEA